MFWVAGHWPLVNWRKPADAKKTKSQGLTIVWCHFDVIFVDLSEVSTLWGTRDRFSTYAAKIEESILTVRKIKGLGRTILINFFSTAEMKKIFNLLKCWDIGSTKNWITNFGWKMNSIWMVYFISSSFLFFIAYGG